MIIGGMVESDSRISHKSSVVISKCQIIDICSWKTLPNNEISCVNKET